MFSTRLDKGLELIGHMGSVLGYTGAMHWLADQDLSMVVLANVGTMHIGSSQPSAASVAFNTDFIQAAKACAQEQRGTALV